MRSDLRGRPPDVSRILPNLLVGEYARVADAGWLQSEHGVSAVLSLQHESDLWDKGVALDELEREYRDRTIEFRHVPVEDTSESDLDAALPRADRGDRLSLHRPRDAARRRGARRQTAPGVRALRHLAAQAFRVAPAAMSPSISARVNPPSERTCAPCSPSAGAGRSGTHGVCEKRR